ncbi:MAG: calcium/sodium antiporter [Bacteroidetes bacterium]|nr:calcium/sodium antiporter [Bacteroidota bacterium]
MALTIVLFIAGFILLIFGANWLVDGAASIARKHKISNIVIGLTIVALGTSSPELVVNLAASFKGSADIAMGNILGSNIANILLILGVSALIFPLRVNSNTQWKEIPFSLLAAVLIGICLNDSLIDGTKASYLYRSDGIVLIAFFILFMAYTFSIAKQKKEDEFQEVKELKPIISWIMIFGGIGGLVLGGKWIVDSSIEIATWLGMSEAVISLTIVALGTSLPELATCVVAAYKKNADIVIGNVIGSNIFNVFFVLGVSAVIKPIPFNEALNFDIIVGIFAAFILIVFLITPRKNILDKWEGGVLFLFYIAYITFLLIRG